MEDYDIELVPCTGCGKLIAEGPRQRCDRCRHAYHFQKKYGISRTEYKEMLESQDGVCAICKEPCVTGRQLAVDHNHECCGPDRACKKCVRGLLCTKCNQGIGMFNDDPERLSAAIKYLKASVTG